MSRIVAIVLALAVFGVTVEAVNPSRVLPSVAGIGVVGSESLHCSAGSIGRSRYLTAAHCVPFMEGVVYTVAGHEAFVVMRDVPNDLAILDVPGTRAPALKLARRAPMAGDNVSAAGHPLGIPDVIFSRGYVMSRRADIGAKRPYAVFALPAAPGSSGSVIVNGRGEIVSVLQVGWSRTFMPTVGGVVWETLDELRGWWR
jgi:S1-C subfamily serine protease